MEYRSKNRCSDGQSSEAPNKRFKTHNNQENSSPRPPSPSQSESSLSFLKGKSKLEPEAESCVCGICLKEAVDDGNNAYRGYIDSCDHYFCFVCIMEWAKIESKCPLCRCRFSTIRRPPKPPLFPCERLICVPVRDQANYNSGNASAGPFDSYHDVECTVCHSSADENLLLLCDLCDSASHTYCVGLNQVVPEGDWFCRDCTLLRDEHRQSKSDAESEELRNSENAHSSSEVITVSDIIRPHESPLRRLERSPERTQSKLTIDSSELSNSRNPNGSPEVVTVFDVVRGPESPIRRIGRSSINFQRKLDIESDDLIHSGNSSSSARNITALDIVRDPESPSRRAVCSPTSNLSGGTIGLDKKGQANNVQDSSRLSARTLHQKRNVLDRIQALRDNWNYLRSGSVNFSSSSSSCNNRIHEVASNSAQPHSTSSTSEQLSSENGLPFVTENRSVHEIDKAWKMMTMAKTLEQKRGREGILNEASKNPLNSKLPSTRDRPLLSVNPAKTRQESLSPLHTRVNKSNNLRTQIFEKRSLSMQQRSQNCRTGFPVSSSPPVRLASPRNTCSPCQNDLFGRNARNLSKKNEAATVLSASSDHYSLSSSVGSASVVSNLSQAKQELPASSSCNIEVPKFKDKSTKEKDPTDPKKRETNDPKSEIQSLVKLNLKLLTKDKQLGVNAFKEVAWKSTDSILAACGLEQPKPGIRIFPSCTCCHVTNGGLDIRRSTLMPYSCRECFYVFVKDVVNTIMLEKIKGADVQ